MSSLSCDADIAAGTDLLGKYVADLQSNVAIVGDEVFGTLKYVDDYTGFSGDPDEQVGHFLVLHVGTGEVSNDRITVQLIGGDHPAVTVDQSDGIVILRIKNTAEKVQFLAYKGSAMTGKVLDLSNLVLEEES